MPTKHLKYGGSTMARTLGCPAWVSLSEKAPQPPEDKGSPAAEKGTCLHDAMEFYEHTHKAMTVKDLIGLSFNNIEITEEDYHDKLLPAAEAIQELKEEYELCDIRVEPFVELIPDLAGGSIDFLGISRDGRVAVVADYKFGFNLIDPEENAQLLFYSLCADADAMTTEAFKHVETLVLAVVQPNFEGEDTLRKWETAIERLDTFEVEVIEAIKISEAGGHAPAAGKHCKFCPSEAFCPIKTGLARAAQRLPTPEVHALAEYLPMADELEQWIAAVRKLAHEQLEVGTPIEGYKLVSKRASRQWTDPKAVEKKIKLMRGVTGTDRYEMKLKSPAQMEKLFKSKGVDFDKIADYITSVPSGTTMAKESDKRPAAPSIGAFKAALAQLPE